mmetsp:Transcript_42423/g.100865  ORF Transcript_42423/g.100865 Transcript_42423/m.100865 type:complete len:211 (-) Transcript_42423:125-757(-)
MVGVLRPHFRRRHHLEVELARNLLERRHDHECHVPARIHREVERPFGGETHGRDGLRLHLNLHADVRLDGPRGVRRPEGVAFRVHVRRLVGTREEDRREEGVRRLRCCHARLATHPLVPVPIRRELVGSREDGVVAPRGTAHDFVADERQAQERRQNHEVRALVWRDRQHLRHRILQLHTRPGHSSDLDGRRVSAERQVVRRRPGVHDVH